MTIRQIATAQDGVCYVIRTVVNSEAAPVAVVYEDGLILGTGLSMPAARKAAEDKTHSRLAIKLKPADGDDFVIVPRDMATQLRARYHLEWRTEVA